MEKCEYYLFKHKPDATGERYPCQWFNAGICEFHLYHEDIFPENCPYIGERGKWWDDEKVKASDNREEEQNDLQERTLE